MENKAFKIVGIRNLMRSNYGLSGSEIDLEAHVDDTLGMAENWNKLKERILILSPKKRGV